MSVRAKLQADNGGVYRLTEDDLDELIEEHSELSSVASERVTWEAARGLLQEEATKAFLAGKDDLAYAYRRVAEEVEKRRADASKRQDAILKKQGRR